MSVMVMVVVDGGGGGGNGGVVMEVVGVGSVVVTLHSCENASVSAVAMHTSLGAASVHITSICTFEHQGARGCLKGV